MTPKQRYAEKLRDPRWQRRRLEIMSRDGFACRRCGDATRTLHVHHLRYSGEPWEAPDAALETLCEDCHKVVTDRDRAAMEAREFLVEYVTTYSPGIEVRALEALVIDPERMAQLVLDYIYGLPALDKARELAMILPQDGR